METRIYRTLPEVPLFDIWDGSRIISDIITRSNGTCALHFRHSFYDAVLPAWVVSGTQDNYASDISGQVAF